MWRNHPRTVEFLCVLGACAVLAMAFTAPWHPNATTIPTSYQGDAEFFARLDASMWTYMLAWGAEHPGRFYDAPILLPVRDPLVANDPRLTEGLWSIPIFRLFSPVTAWGVTLWLALTFTAVGCYYAGKLLTGSRWGGAAVAVLFSFGMFRANHVCHIEGTFAPFLALSLAVMVRFLERPGRRATIVFALALTAATIEYSYIAVPLALTLPFAIGWGIWRRGISWKQGLMPVIYSGALSAIILLPVAVKYASFHRNFGVQRPLDQVDGCSADLFAWITGPTGRMLPPFGDAFEHIFVDPQLFPGFILTLLGIAGAILLWRKAPEIVIVGALAFLLSFGTLRMLLWQLGVPPFEARTPYEVLYDWVLPLKAIRAPARFAVLTHLALAFGGAMVLTRMAARRSGRILAVGVLAVAFMEASAGIHAVRILPERYDDPAYRWLAEQPGDFAVLHAPMGLHAVRDEHVGEAEQMLIALIHGKRIPNGTLAAELPWHESIAVNTRNPSHGEAQRLMRALGIRYVVAADPATTAAYDTAGFHRVCASEAGTVVFKVDSPLPVPSSPRDVAERLAGDSAIRKRREAGRRQGASLRAPADAVMHTGRHFVLPVLVRNTGEMPWTSLGQIYGDTDFGDVAVGIRRWRDMESGAIAGSPREATLSAAAFLPANLMPGEGVVVSVAGVAPIRPGRYVAEIDMSATGIGWLSPPDHPAASVEVTVE